MVSQAPTDHLNATDLTVQAFAAPSETLPYGSSVLVELQEVLTDALEELAPAKQVQVFAPFGWLIRRPPVTAVRIGALEYPPPGCPLQIQVAAGVVVDVPLSLALYREVAIACRHNYLGRFYLQEGAAPKEAFGLVAVRETLPASFLAVGFPAGREMFATTVRQIGVLARASTDRFIEQFGGRPLTEQDEFGVLLSA